MKQEDSEKPPIAQGSTNLSNDELISIWAKAVDTQMHFNEMSVKSRQLGLTFIATAPGIGIVMISQNHGFSITANVLGYSLRIHVAVMLTLAALAAVWAVRGLDLGVYHRMLRGAVTFGEDLEETHLKRLFGLQKGMTQAISHFSRHSDAKVQIGDQGGYEYSGCNHKTAEVKIRAFYRWVMIFLVLGSITLLVITNIEKQPISSPAKQDLNILR